MASTLNILVIEDSLADFQLLERQLRQDGMAAAMRRVDRDQALEAALQEGGWDLVLSDYRVPGMDFRASLLRIRERCPALPVILVSGSIGEVEAIELLRLGLTDFVLKDHLARMPSAIERALQESADRRGRRSAEAELHKVSKAVEQSPATIVITDLDARIEYVNEAFLRQTGYARDEVLGQNARLMRSGRSAAPVHASLWQALARGETWKGEFLNRRKDGSEYTDFAIVSPIRQADGRITHYVSAHEDITESKRLAEELDAHRHHLEQLVAQRTAELELARRQAESANRAKSAFLANMSHEIRTPMNAILGLTHLMRREASAPLAFERLQKIDTAARHLLAVVNDVLDLSKIEAGKVLLESLDYAIADLLAETAGLIAGQAHDKGLVVQIDHQGVPPWLRGDATRLRQALLNYAGNAVKFTHQGTVTLRCRVQAQQDDRLLLRFEVQDTGVGVPAEVLPRLFDAFEQADTSTTRQYGGTGLGLAITRRIAGLMGGETGASSTPGQGSCFWFTVWQPIGHATKRPTHNPANEAELSRLHRGTRLLLCEDNAVNREVAQEMLMRAGLQVDTAANGRLALAMARSGNHALILMDMRMPEMDGLQATRAIRALPQGRDVPILAMTANAFDEDRQACLAAGMNGFLAKPVDAQALYAALMKWLPAKTPLPAEDRTAPMPEPALESPLQDMLQRLADEPGVDLGRGLKAVLGNPQRYMGLLQKLVAAHGDDPARLRTAIRSGDTEAADRLTHSLKGAAAQLGLAHLADDVAALEHCKKHETSVAAAELDDLIHKVEARLQRLQAMLWPSMQVQ